MAVDEDELRVQMIRGVELIKEEFQSSGTAEDLVCLNYVLNEEAGSSVEQETLSPTGLQADCGIDGCVLPERRVGDEEGFTRQVGGMRLADFMSHPLAKLCGLKEQHVVAPSRGASLPLSAAIHLNVLNDSYDRVYL